MRTLTSLTLVAIAVFASGGVAVIAQNQSQNAQHASQDHQSSSYEQCARARNECQLICDACATHCAMLVADGKKEHLATLKTCRDCATFCSAAAEIVAAKGPFADLICQACADACKRCGDECMKYEQDPMMKNCAQECRDCEKACREMLKHVSSN